MKTEFNKLSEAIHSGNAKRGFWDNERQLPELLMLVVSELSEALEADRSSLFATPNSIDTIKNILKDENYNNEHFKVRFEQLIKNTVQDEIADAIIRLFDLAYACGIDLDFHIDAKLKYNETRGYKHGKKY